MKNKLFSKKLFSLFFSFYMILSVIPVHIFAENNPQQPQNNNVITTVDIGNIWKNLDSTKPIAFTAEINPNNSECTGKMKIIEEQWKSLNEPIDIIKSSDKENHKPRNGEKYSYSITLAAEDGYIFSEDFSDEYNNIKNENNVKFICDGDSYTGKIDIKNDGKIFIAESFLPPTTVLNGDVEGDTVIKTVNITGANLSYTAGDTPIATASSPNNAASNYEVECEYWEEIEQTSNGFESVKYWCSDKIKYDSLPDDKKIKFFEEGKTYVYSLEIKTTNGRTFASTDLLTMTLNGEQVNSNNLNLDSDGTKLFAVELKTIKPTKQQEFKSTEINTNDISSTSTKKIVQTSDSYNTTFWLVLLFITGNILLGISFLQKNKNMF